MTPVRTDKARLTSLTGMYVTGAEAPARSHPNRFFTHLYVHHAPNGTYGGALAVLSEDPVLFLKRDAPCLELCSVLRDHKSERSGEY